MSSTYSGSIMNGKLPATIELIDTTPRYQKEDSA